MKSNLDLFWDNVKSLVEAVKNKPRYFEVYIRTDLHRIRQEIDTFKIEVTEEYVQHTSDEVVAPANKDSIVRKFYIVDLPAEKVHEVYSKYLEHFKHYWATEEDAQKALDAMLIPFNQ